MKNDKCYEILLNYTCNARCLFCSQGDFDKTRNSSFDSIIKEIYRAKKMGYSKLGLSGGEPTLREDLLEIIKFAYKIGFRFIRIQTNGIKLNDFSYAKKLKDAGVSYLKFSIISDKPKIHDMLTSVNGSWKRTIKAMENMIKLKIRVGNNILINKYNYNELERIIKFFLKKGVSNIVVIYPLYIGNMFKNKSLWVPLYKCSNHFINAIKIMDKIDIRDELLFLNVPPCFLKQYWQLSIGVEAFNTIVTSPDGDKINLDENSNTNKVKGEICNNCPIKHKCLGVDANYISIFGWKGFKELDKKYIKGEHNTIKYITDNEKCLVEILRIKNNIPTETLLKLAKGIPLCRDCKDGNNIINAAAKLVSKNIIEMKFIKGKYYFKLLKKDI